MRITIYTLASSRNPNEIRYVGKTRQTVKRRLQGHICCAKKARRSGNCTNHNYNWINHELDLGNTIIAEEVESLEFEEGEDWDWFEQYWIAQFREWGFNLTNIKPGGEDSHYTEPTEEVLRKRAEHIIGIARDEKTREKISKGLTGLQKSDETIEKIRRSIVEKQGRPVLQCDKITGEVIKEWSSGAEAARAIGADKGNLNACCRGKKKSCKGFVWKYKYPDEVPERRIVQLDKEGNIIRIFENSAVIQSELGIDSNLVNNVCKGKQPETYHCIFKYYNDVFKK